jgi:PAS domain S-box-containing protein
MPLLEPETRRLEVLRSYGVLDTAREPAYDEIAALAAALCETPVAVISLVEEDRQWFKAVHGADWQSTTRDISFCAHAIEQRELFIVEDASADPRFGTNPLVCGEIGLRFYAGMPLIDSEGVALGALAVIDRVPRTLGPVQHQALRVLAAQVVAQLQGRRRQRMLEDALLQRERGHAALRDSESRWRLLFERNPLPMWIFDTETLRFLAVNDAAVLQYGWSSNEFLSMTLKDIRPLEDVPALMDDLAKGHTTLHGGEIWRHRKKNGQVIHVDIVAHSISFDGRAARLVLAQDVSDRLLAEQALRASEARWQRLFAASAIGIAAADANGLFASANPAFCALIQRPEPEVLGQPILGFTHPDDISACRRELHRLETGKCETVTIDKRYLRPDGDVRWARTTITMTHGTDSSERQVVAVVQDIDAQHRAEQALARQHALVQAAGRLARLGGWAVTKYPRQLVRWTDELRTILDISQGDVPSVEDGINLYLPGSRERISAALQACLENGQSFDLQLDMRTAQGRPLHVRVLGEPRFEAAGHIDGAQGALIDMTELYAAQQAVQRSEERFRHVARATADAIWDWDLTTGSVWWNEGVETLFGHAPTTMEPGAESWTTRIHPADLPRVKESIEAVIAGNSERWAAEYRFARADGSWADVHDRGFVVRNDLGHALRMVGGMSDLSEQRRAERQLRQQAELLDATRDAIVVRDLDDRITYWSRGAERLFGWSAAEAEGRRAPELLAEDEMVFAHAREEVLRRGEWQAVVQCRARDGRAMRADVRLTLLRDAAGAPESVLSIKTDVTNRMALESQLQQAQRLEAVGQLTGGVAHDFNNLLTVIQGNAELLAEQLVEREDLTQMAQMISMAAERGAELTQRLLAFARKQPLQPQSVDAHHLLAGMDGLLRRTLPEDIELELVRAAGLWPLLADPVQVESAVLNLVLNARDAMPAGGKITLETANAWVDQDYAERHVDVLPGQYVLISVSDTGVGMTSAELARAFEPFFTTKCVGKGSGLGLSMVYGFAKQSRGHVKLYSEPGQGTTARLYLPRADSAGMPIESKARRAEGDLRGSAIVLVVEDDELVRRFASELLRGLGYQVLAAENGAAALGVLRTRNDVELLFTDVVMPGGLNGRQLADAAISLHPQLKVLFTSGYTENAIVHHGRLDRGVHLLAKPYRAVDLARKVRAMLE